MNIEYILNNEWLWKIYDRLLRPENNPDGRDVIELELRECDECDDEYWIYILNEGWLWKRTNRLLRPENNPDGRDVIELELR